MAPHIFNILVERMWACEPRALSSYLDAVQRVRCVETTPEAIAAQAKPGDDDVFSLDGGTATIKIHGTLTPNGPGLLERMFGIGGTAYNDIVTAAALAMDPDVEQVVLDMSTPGGTVAGLEAAHLALLELAAEKPVKAVASGMLASAGYWLASAADEIIAVNKTTEIGSIGVALAVHNPDGWVDIASSNAPKKRPDVNTKEGLDVYREELDAMERIFISAVADGRGVSTDTVKKKYGQGGMYIAHDPDESKPDALRNGMIDAFVNSFGEALNHGSTAATAGPKTPDEEERMQAKLDALQADLARVTAERDDLLARVEATSKFFGSSAYPKAILDLAGAVLAGSKPVATLDGAVVAYDAMQQSKVSAAAAVDSSEAPEGISDAPTTGEEKSVADQLKNLVEETMKAKGE